MSSISNLPSLVCEPVYFLQSKEIVAIKPDIAEPVLVVLPRAMEAEAVTDALLDDGPALGAHVAVHGEGREAAHADVVRAVLVTLTRLRQPVTVRIRWNV